MTHQYRAETRDIEVLVTPSFVKERSCIEENQYFYQYDVSIVNHGNPIRLLERKFHIRDGNGKRYDTHGRGITGETPYIDGEFNYTSFMPLHSKCGNMRGSFLVERNDEKFWIEVPLTWYRLEG